MMSDVCSKHHSQYLRPTYGTDWICALCENEKLRQRLAAAKAERDEAREAARWLFANLDHAAEVDVEGAAETRWPWLSEGGGRNPG
jgi:hypothetical protein